MPSHAASPKTAVQSSVPPSRQHQEKSSSQHALARKARRIGSKPRSCLTSLTMSNRAMSSRVRWKCGRAKRTRENSRQDWCARLGASKCNGIGQYDSDIWVSVVNRTKASQSIGLRILIFCFFFNSSAVCASRSSRPECVYLKGLEQTYTRAYLRCQTLPASQN